ncbi:MAG TPA: sulfite exporter TauE/SafE family protein [Acidobacteriaceae bacterium]|nr:sulfite exporter TauE/SafE family protein [Acidobacteriaceae bacterium]
MEYLIGFVIAVFIALTGVGAGTITTPMLVLVLGVPVGIAVSVGLMFSAAVKLVLLPAQIWRKQVSWRTLGYMLVGGVPGVLAGAFLLHRFVDTGAKQLVNGTLGVVLVFTALWQIFFSFRPVKPERDTRDRARLLPWLMLPVGAEVGFSSAGAGALGSAALLALTPLAPAQVVGTDIAFGFLTSSLGSGAHWFGGAVNGPLLIHLVAGGLAGALLGTMLAGSVPKRPLRFALWVWLLVIGGIFLYHSASFGVAAAGVR